MAITRRSKSRTSKPSAKRIVEQQMSASVSEGAREARLPASQVQALTSAKIDYYLLIDFGFTAGQPFVPNSVQFYSNTNGFLCYKTVDNASLVSLVPILNCPSVWVTWDTATQEAKHIYGKKP